MGLECSEVYQHSFTFWSVTLQPLGADKAAIPHLKEDSNTFHTTPILLYYMADKPVMAPVLKKSAQAS